MVHILSFLLALQSVGARPQQPDLPALIKKIQPSVVTVLTYDSRGNRLKQGSGFFITADGRFVTNVHVLEGAYRAEIKTQDGGTYDVKEVLADDAVADVVIAGLDCPTKSRTSVVCDTKSTRLQKNGLPQFHPLILSRTQPEIGQSVLVIGSPLGLEQTVSTGIISAIRNLDGTGQVFQISAPISPGSSGSPVVNLRGEVVGIATSQYTEGQNLNFAVPADRLPKPVSSSQSVELWARRYRSVRIIEAAEQYYHKGDELLGSGKCNEAVPYYQEAVRMAPDFSSDWWSPLAFCLGEVQRYDEAIGAYKQGIRLKPASSLYDGLGDDFSEAGRNIEAIEAYKEAIRLDGARWSAYTGLGDSYFKLQRYQDAIQAMR